MYYKRQYCIDKFSSIFDLVVDDPIVLNLEKSIFNETIKYCKEKSIELKWSNMNFSKKYSQLARKVIANTTYTPNASEVKQKILKNIWPAETIAAKTHPELHPEYYAEIKLKIMAKHINMNPEQEHDGFFTCGKCKSIFTLKT